jgi:hypothetical protein
MERWRVCPDCRSTNMRCDIGVTSRAGDKRYANTIFYGPTFLGMGNSVAVDLFVCGDCGSVRTYVSDSNALDYINEKWPRVDTLSVPEEEALRQRLEKELQDGADDEYEDRG